MFDLLERAFAYDKWYDEGGGDDGSNPGDGAPKKFQPPPPPAPAPASSGFDNIVATSGDWSGDGAPSGPTSSAPGPGDMPDWGASQPSNPPPSDWAPEAPPESGFGFAQGGGGGEHGELQPDGSVAVIDNATGQVKRRESWEQNQGMGGAGGGYEPSSRTSPGFGSTNEPAPESPFGGTNFAVDDPRGGVDFSSGYDPSKDRYIPDFSGSTNQTYDTSGQPEAPPSSGFGFEQTPPRPTYAPDMNGERPPSEFEQPSQFGATNEPDRSRFGVEVSGDFSQNPNAQPQPGETNQPEAFANPFLPRDEKGQVITDPSVWGLVGVGIDYLGRGAAGVGQALTNLNKLGQATPEEIEARRNLPIGERLGLVGGAITSGLEAGLTKQSNARASDTFNGEGIRQAFSAVGQDPNSPVANTAVALYKFGTDALYDPTTYGPGAVGAVIGKVGQVADRLGIPVVRALKIVGQSREAANAAEVKSLIEAIKSGDETAIKSAQDTAGRPLADWVAEHVPGAKAVLERTPTGKLAMKADQLETAADAARRAGMTPEDFVKAAAGEPVEGAEMFSARAKQAAQELAPKVQQEAQLKTASETLLTRETEAAAKAAEVAGLPTVAQSIRQAASTGDWEAAVIHVVAANPGQKGKEMAERLAQAAERATGNPIDRAVASTLDAFKKAQHTPAAPGSSRQSFAALDVLGREISSLYKQGFLYGSIPTQIINVADNLGKYLFETGGRVSFRKLDDVTGQFGWRTSELLDPDMLAGAAREGAAKGHAIGWERLPVVGGLVSGAGKAYGAIEGQFTRGLAKISLLDTAKTARRELVQAGVPEMMVRKAGLDPATGLGKDLAAAFRARLESGAPMRAQDFATDAQKLLEQGGGVVTHIPPPAPKLNDFIQSVSDELAAIPTTAPDRAARVAQVIEAAKTEARYRGAANLAQVKYGKWADGSSIDWKKTMANAQQELYRAIRRGDDVEVGLRASEVLRTTAQRVAQIRDAKTAQIDDIFRQLRGSTARLDTPEALMAARQRIETQALRAQAAAYREGLEALSDLKVPNLGSAALLRTKQINAAVKQSVEAARYMDDLVARIEALQDVASARVKELEAVRKGAKTPLSREAASSRINAEWEKLAQQIDSQIEINQQRLGALSAQQPTITRPAAGVAPRTPGEIRVGDTVEVPSSFKVQAGPQGNLGQTMTGTVEEIRPDGVVIRTPEGRLGIAEKESVTVTTPTPTARVTPVSANVNPVLDAQARAAQAGFWRLQDVQADASLKSVLEQLDELGQRMAQAPVAPAVAPVATDAAKVNAAARQMGQAWSDVGDYAVAKAYRDQHRVYNDYVNGKTRLDRVLNTAIPFSMWQTRNPIYYGEMLLRNPSLGAALVVYDQKAEQQRQAKNLPASYRGQFSFGSPNVPLLGLKGDEELFVNPLAAPVSLLDQTYQALSSYNTWAIVDAKAKRGLADPEDVRAAELAFYGNLAGGLGTYPFISDTLTLFGVLGERQIGNLGPNVPFTSATRALFGGDIYDALGVHRWLTDRQYDTLKKPAPWRGDTFQELAVATQITRQFIRQEISQAQMYEALLALKNGEGDKAPAQNPVLQQAIEVADKNKAGNNLRAALLPGRFHHLLAPEQSEAYNARAENAAQTDQLRAEIEASGGTIPPGKSPYSLIQGPPAPEFAQNPENQRRLDVLSASSATGIKNPVELELRRQLSERAALSDMRDRAQYDDDPAHALTKAYFQRKDRDQNPVSWSQGKQAKVIYDASAAGLTANVGAPASEATAAGVTLTPGQTGEATAKGQSVSVRDPDTLVQLATSGQLSGPLSYQQQKAIENRLSDAFDERGKVFDAALAAQGPAAVEFNTQLKMAKTNADRDALFQNPANKAVVQQYYAARRERDRWDAGQDPKTGRPVDNPLATVYSAYSQWNQQNGFPESDEIKTATGQGKTKEFVRALGAGMVNTGAPAGTAPPRPASTVAPESSQATTSPTRPNAPREEPLGVSPEQMATRRQLAIQDVQDKLNSFRSPEVDKVIEDVYAKNPDADFNTVRAELKKAGLDKQYDKENRAKKEYIAGAKTNSDEQQIGAWLAAYQTDQAKNRATAGQTYDEQQAELRAMKAPPSYERFQTWVRDHHGAKGLALLDRVANKGSGGPAIDVGIAQGKAEQEAIPPGVNPVTPEETGEPTITGRSVTAAVKEPRTQADGTSRENFVASILPAAQVAERETGIPANIIVAIAAHESNYGKAGSNMLFGVKGNGRTYDTYEVEHGQAVKQQSSFRTYPSVEAAVNDFTQLVTTGRYAPAYEKFKQTGDAGQFVKDLQSAGYATDPEWGSKITRFASTSIDPLVAQAGTLAAPTQTQQAILDAGRALLGTKYTWGGTKPEEGLDCSAFVSQAWGVPRQTTDTISKVSTPITKDQLQAGDALNLPTWKDNREGHPGHIQLFVKWANADHTQMVVIDSSGSNGGVKERTVAYDPRFEPIRKNGVEAAPVGSTTGGNPPGNLVGRVPEAIRSQTQAQLQGGEPTRGAGLGSETGARSTLPRSSSASTIGTLADAARQGASLTQPGSVKAPPGEGDTPLAQLLRAGGRSIEQQKEYVRLELDAATSRIYAPREQLTGDQAAIYDAYVKAEDKPAWIKQNQAAYTGVVKPVSDAIRKNRTDPANRLADAFLNTEVAVRKQLPGATAETIRDMFIDNVVKRGKVDEDGNITAPVVVVSGTGASSSGSSSSAPRRSGGGGGGGGGRGNAPAPRPATPAITTLPSDAAREQQRAGEIAGKLPTNLRSAVLAGNPATLSQADRYALMKWWASYPTNLRFEQWLELVRQALATPIPA